MHDSPQNIQLTAYNLCTQKCRTHYKKNIESSSPSTSNHPYKQSHNFSLQNNFLCFFGAEMESIAKLKHNPKNYSCPNHSPCNIYRKHRMEMLIFFAQPSHRHLGEEQSRENKLNLTFTLISGHKRQGLKMRMQKTSFRKLFSATNFFRRNNKKKEATNDNDTNEGDYDSMRFIFSAMSDFCYIIYRL